jgi:hypothetical protein
VSELSLAQRDRLAELEAIIETTINDFLEVAKLLVNVEPRKTDNFLQFSLALLEIRDTGLYAPHEDFNAYLKNRFGWGRTLRFYRVRAAETMTLLFTRVNSSLLPRNEYDCRALAELEVEEKVAVLNTAAGANEGVLPSASRLKELADKAVASRGMTPEERREQIAQNERRVLEEASSSDPSMDADAALAGKITRWFEAAKRKARRRYGEQAAAPFCRAVDQALQHLTRL